VRSRGPSYPLRVDPVRLLHRLDAVHRKACWATILAGIPFDHNVRVFPTEGAVVAELQQRIEELLPAV